MNLMFWKKKTGAVAEAENAPGNLALNTRSREPLDFVAAKRDDAGRNPEPSERELIGADETGLESTATPGWAARIRLRLGALTSHFKRAPAFRAEVEQGDAAPTLPESPANHALAMRIKLRLIALVRRFKKTPAAGAAEGKETGLPGRSEDFPEDERHDVEQETMPARSRKRLYIGGAAGLMILLLAGVVIAYWPLFEAPEKKWGTKHDMASIPSRSIDFESAPEASRTSVPETPRSEVEALKKENAELQARIEALEKKQQQPSAPPARKLGREGADTLSASGEMVVGSEDPKSAAMSLKEAIESMNAGSGDYSKKPAK